MAFLYNLRKYSWSIVPSDTMIVEGDSITFSIATDSPVETIPYSLTGLSTADYTTTSVARTGVLSLVNGKADVRFETATDDLAEATETMQFTLGLFPNRPVVVDVLDDAPVFTLTSDVDFVAEGSKFTITLTTNLADGSFVPYLITGVQVADIGASLSGAFTVMSGTGTKTFSVALDGTTGGEGTEVFRMVLTNPQSTAEVLVPIFDFVLVPVLTTDTNSVTEGDKFSITLTTNGLADGTRVAYVCTGISQADVLGVGVTGYFIMQNNNATLKFSAYRESLYGGEGNETMRLTLKGRDEYIEVEIVDYVADLTLSTDVELVCEGETFTITLAAPNVPDNTWIAYNVTGIAYLDVGTALSGYFVIVGGMCSIKFKVRVDSLSGGEGAETFVLTIPGSGDTISVTILDYAMIPILTPSKTQVNEPDEFEIRFDAVGVPNNSVIWYDITGITSSDINNDRLSWYFYVKDGTAVRSFNVVRESLYGGEGNETLRLTLRNRAEFTEVTIIDYQITPILTSTASEVVEGNPFTISVVAEGAIDGLKIPYTITGISRADIGNTALVGNFVVNSGVASIIIPTTFGGIASGKLDNTFKLSLDRSTYDISVIVRAYVFDGVISSDVAEVIEGTSVAITLTASNLPEGFSIPYVITGTGVTYADFTIPTLNGTFTVVNGSGTVNLTPARDAIYANEGPEVMHLQIKNRPEFIDITILDYGISGAVSVSVSEVTEGEPFVVTVTTDAADGTVIPYTISGTVSSADIGGAALVGNVTINNGVATRTFTTTRDSLFGGEGDELFIFTVPALNQSVPVTIHDFAIEAVLSAPPVVGEGRTFTVSLVTNIPSVVIPYTITGNGITSADLNGASLTGSFITDTAGNASKIFVVTTDATYEGLERFNLAITDMPSVNVSVSLIDYQLTVSNLSVLEGQSTVVTLLAKGTPDGTVVPYVISGVASTDINVSLTGNFVVVDETATLAIQLLPNSITVNKLMRIGLVDCATEAFTNCIDSALFEDARRSTVLYVKADVVNGATNTTIVDESDYHQPVVHVGAPAPEISSLTPVSNSTGKWSVYYAGVRAEHLRYTSTNGLNIGSLSQYTIECWALSQKTTINTTLFDSRPYLSTIDAVPTVTLKYTAENVFSVYYNGVSLITTTNFSINRWHHIAVVLETSGLMTLWLNGMKEGSYTGIPPGASVTTVLLGNSSITATNPTSVWKGYISNFRISNTAVYTSVFTPSTEPLGSTPSTMLLTCNHFNFELPSVATNVTILGPLNYLVISHDHPFNSDTHNQNVGSWGSGLLDALDCGNQMSLEPEGFDFTLECYFYSVANGSTIVSKRFNSTSYSGILVTTNSNNVICYAAGATGGSWPVTIKSNIEVSSNSWNHVAFQRIQSDWTVWINGKNAGSKISNHTVKSSTSKCLVGTGVETRIAGYRFVKGVGLYTDNFIPEPIPTNVPGTTILLNFRQMGITDSVNKQALTAFGGATISTTQSKYGGASMWFDGVLPSRVEAMNDPSLDLTGTDFSIDAWIYCTVSGTNGCIISKDRAYSGNAHTGASYHLGLITTNQIIFDVGIRGGAYDRVKSPNPIQINTWIHVGGCRVGNQLMLYINGLLVAAKTQTVTQTNSIFPVIVGGVGSGLTTNVGMYTFVGYIDSVRIVRGKSLFIMDFDPEQIV